MKKFLIIFILANCSLVGFNQTYVPLLEDENTWNVLFSAVPWPYPFDTTYSTTTYKINGDTLINSILYKKMYSTDEETPQNWDLFGFMREDTTKKVWLKFDNDDEEYLMYDYSINPGDSIKVGFGGQEDLFVDSVTIITIEGTSLKKYWFSCLVNPYYHEYWIEGIGSNQGIVWSGSASFVGGFSRLLCLSKNGLLYFMNPDYSTCYLNTVGVDAIRSEPFVIYPNPAKDFIAIKHLKGFEIKSITILDLIGRIVKEFDSDNTSLDIASLSKGIYMLRIITGQDQFVKKIMID